MPTPLRGPAFGAPGIEPRWTRSDKRTVGTAYSASSRVWYTLSAGIISEVYYPTIDRPQIRDLQYLVTDGRTFFHDERRHLDSQLEQLDSISLGFRLTNTNPEQGYRITKEIIADPHYPCLLVHTRLDAEPEVLERLQLYALLAPHLEVGGLANNGYVAEVGGYKIMLAMKGNTWLAMGTSSDFLRRSCGFVGHSDGWTDLNDNREMDYEFDSAENGNIALTAQLDLARGREFTLAVSLGSCRQSAQSTLLQALGVPFAEQRERFLEQWHRVCGHITSKPMPSDGHALFRRSHSLLLAHEDKSFSGAMIASLSIPWGEAKSDEDLGGYHLVWPRDMAHSATALLASGNTDTPYRALIYLASIQATNGGFHQNFWIDGDPFWTGVQLDQVSFMILLAWRVARAGALKEFDPYPMVLRAAAFLIAEGPATGQERWEENSGYSPSTLAANIAALCCAAKMAELRKDQATARFLQDYADFLESHLDGWTTTTQGTLVPGISRHYIRILPIDLGNPMAMEDPNRALVEIKNRPPGAPWVFPAKEIVDGGFLELVRYGIRKPDDPLVVDSVAVVDRVLKVETSYGPCWRRYNHDGYGQRDDGGPFLGWGRGRGWPLLTGERGHYELAAGHDARPYLRALEQFAQDGLLSEQVWDADDRPDDRLWRGRPTGAAMPLVWAHAEYMTLVRSVADGKVYDLIDHVAERYQGPTKPLAPEVWKPQRHARSITRGQTLRVMANEPFLLHWTANNWQQIDDTPSTPTKLGLHFVDVTTEVHQTAPIRFTFFWLDSKRWEGRDYAVSIDPDAGA